MTKTMKKSGTERRHELINMTSQLKAAAAMGKISGCTADTSANVLLKIYYAKKGHTQLKTYDEWKESGYQVKRGESALMIWSRKKTFKYTKKDENGQETDEQGEYSAFAICNLFSNLQVESIAKKEEKPAEVKEIASKPIPEAKPKKSSRPKSKSKSKSKPEKKVVNLPTCTIEYDGFSLPW